MQTYIIRRVLLFFPTLFIASVVIFGIMRIIPGDVARFLLGEDDQAYTQEQLADLRKHLGLSDPLHVQYGKWAWSMLSGKFGGKSLVDNEEISELVSRRFPISVQLTVLTLVIALSISLPLGVAAAVYQDRSPDYALRSIAILGLAMPNFWVSLLLIQFLVIVFHWSPPFVYANVWDDPIHHLQMTIWPALVLAWGYSSNLIRITRSSMLEVLRQDYVRTARAKGLSSRSVIWIHALRNALIPFITQAGGHLGSLLGGTIILENIFAIPGLGQGVIQAATTNDYPVIQSLIMVLTFIVMGVNLLIDITYGIIDPRIGYR